MIGLRDVQALRQDTIVWDRGKGAVAGFGARRRSGEAVVYLVKYRATGGRQRWHVIGRHGVITPEEARRKAKAILGAVANGGDPAAARDATRAAKTIAELCDFYLAEVEAGRVITRRSRRGKKASTIATDRGRIERHIKPLIGRLAVRDVTPADIEKFRNAVAEGRTAARIKTGRHGLARVSGGKGTATRTLGLLGAIFTFAIRRELRADNPCALVEKYADNRRERRLSDEEYAALGAALKQAEMAVWEAEATGKAMTHYGVRRATATLWPPAIAAVRFLALTGWRLGEVIGLRWPEVDLARLTAVLPDTKSGRSIRPLSNRAVSVLKTMPRIGIGDGFVFPATRGDVDTRLSFKKFLPRLIKAAGLPDDITAHVFRHSFASIAADLGYSDLTIAALIGHRGQSVTSRYVHGADAVLVAAADTAADRIAELMAQAKPGGRSPASTRVFTIINDRPLNTPL